MRIVFPINYLPLGEMGGMETYSRSLIYNLQKIDQTNEYSVICANSNEKAFPLTGSNFNKVIIDRFRIIEKARSLTKKVLSLMKKAPFLRDIKKDIEGFAKTIYQKTHSPGIAFNEQGDDLIHHMFTILPYVSDTTTILTVHDIQQEYFPDFFSQKELEERRNSHRPSAEKADHIIAISQFTKDTLIEKYGIPEEKISVVYNGFDQDTFTALDAKTIKKFRKTYGLPESFLLYPAATWKHKNHNNLIKAYKVLKEKYQFRDKLVLTGIKKGNHESVMARIRELGLEKDIIHLGYLPYEQLPALYNASDILVFPSFFEGFGIPVIEAMAVGLPVACSNTTSLPEIGGDAALYFDPFNPEDIAEKLFTLHKDMDLRKKSISKGLEQVKKFTWENTAKETLQIYEKTFSKIKSYENKLS
ncbi:MAG: glycosyltransferase family 1 protein [Nitrospirota bacterium]